MTDSSSIHFEEPPARKRCIACDQCDLVCPHCLSRLVDPRTLFCGHTFCSECLKQLLNHRALTCPVCFHGSLEQSNRISVNRFLQKALTVSENSVDMSSIYSESNNTVMEALTNGIAAIQNCLTLKQSEEALIRAKQLRKTHPAEHRSYFWYGLCLNEVGRRGEALDVLFNAMQLNPFEESIEKAMMKLLEGDNCILDGPTTPESSANPSKVSSAFGNPLPSVPSCKHSNMDDIEACEKSQLLLETPIPPKCSCLYTNMLPRDEFECNLCYRLFLRPTTTPCGHTFCRNCLQRALDHRLSCPLCNYDLTEYFNNGLPQTCVLLERIIMQLWRNEYQERDTEFSKDLMQFTDDANGHVTLVPVMVCTLALPDVPCPLHIFEPRYRAMVRMTMENGTKKFGMAMPVVDEATNLSKYPDIITVLKIKRVEYTLDGRCILETMGVGRYQVMARYMRDGYNVAKVLPFSDHPIHEQDRSSLKQFCRRVHDLAGSWFLQQQPSIREMIVSHWGQLPEVQPNLLGTDSNGPAWHWWLTSVLPLTQNMKYKLMCTQSPALRLSILAKCLLRINFAEKHHNQDGTHSGVVDPRV